jgi:hypothetical protein
MCSSKVQVDGVVYIVEPDGSSRMLSGVPVAFVSQKDAERLIAERRATIQKNVDPERVLRSSCKEAISALTTARAATVTSQLRLQTVVDLLEKGQWKWNSEDSSNLNEIMESATNASDQVQKLFQTHLRAREGFWQIREPNVYASDVITSKSTVDSDHSGRFTAKIPRFGRYACVAIASFSKALVGGEAEKQQLVWYCWVKRSIFNQSVQIILNDSNNVIYREISQSPSVIQAFQNEWSSAPVKNSLIQSILPESNSLDQDFVAYFKETVAYEALVKTYGGYLKLRLEELRRSLY